MFNLKGEIVVAIETEGLRFSNGYYLYSDHQQDCCEHHYLDFSDFKLTDFRTGTGTHLHFDLEGDFVEKVEGFGIRLLPVYGHPIPVPGYGSNNGYYSHNLKLVLEKDGKIVTVFDITKCQDW